MAFSLNEIVPWGRNFEEYRKMFDLNEDELKLKILGCGDGPASFNSECNDCGGNVISIDPIYQMTREEIKKKINETYTVVLSQAEKNKERYIWNTIKSIDHLGKIRMEAMTKFLASYDEGKRNKKYLFAMLPDLPFEDMEFDIALSSHFLFLYTDKLTYEFHYDAIKEMLRVSKEIRIFPLLDIHGERSPYVQRIISDFKENSSEIRRVNYEFQTGGNKLLRICRKT